MSGLAALVDVATPTMDGLITLASAARHKNYRKEGLTLEKMGIAGMPLESLWAFI
jgi:hypothetical protein